MANHRNFGGELSVNLKELFTDPDNVIPEPYGPGNILGEFVLQNNTKKPAIYTGPVPSTWAISGLQVIIGLLPAQAKSYHIGNPDGYGMVQEEGLWPVMLRQHPTAAANLLLKSENEEFLDSTIELAHGRLFSWAKEIQMRTEADDNRGTGFIQAVYLIPYDYTYRKPLGIS
jgi:hypothetical protein